MTPSIEDPRRELRHAAYWLLIIASVGIMTGRILAVRSSLGKTPLLCANDRSRWCTIRALVDHGTYVIDDVIFKDRGQEKRDREWYTIDMVRHKGHDGLEHYYSSKPPLLPTLLAGEYWLVKQMTGATLAERPFYVVRIMLLATHVLPMVLYFFLLIRLVERYGTTDWGRLFAIAAAAYGTFVTTFAVTLNNHLIAAVSAAIAVYAALPIWCDGERRFRHFVVAGIFAAFTAANELPALSFLGLVGLALFWRSPSRTLLAFVPAVAAIAAAFFLTNYLAHESLRPPYMHRGNGESLGIVAGDFQQQMDEGVVPGEVRRRLSDVGIELSAKSTVQRRPNGSGWMLWDPDGHDRLAIDADENGLRIYAWDDWYEYERSYWVAGRKTGVDLGEPSRASYAFHVLLGHHGVFSLTPVWLMSMVGIGYWLTRDSDRMRGFAVLVATLTLLCLAFYIARPLKDRNYGGVSCGFRWMFWFTPLWLIAMLPAVDIIAGRRKWRRVAIALLLVSAVSAAYASMNPWSHPWLYRYWAFLGWVEL